MKKINVAITGGIGCGKSTVIEYIESLGYPVFSCDEIYRDVIEKKEYIDKISQAFPSTVVNGKIDRRILSEIVFADKQKRKQLNALSHPLIMTTLYQRMQNCTNALTFAEVPLLFEENLEKEFDRVIVVLREKQKRMDSIRIRDDLDESAIKQRMDAQFNYEAKENKIRLEKCNAIIINNDQAIEELYTSIDKIISNLNLL